MTKFLIMDEGIIIVAQSEISYVWIDRKQLGGTLLLIALVNYF